MTKLDPSRDESTVSAQKKPRILSTIFGSGSSKAQNQDISDAGGSDNNEEHEHEDGPILKATEHGTASADSEVIVEAVDVHDEDTAKDTSGGASEKESKTANLTVIETGKAQVPQVDLEGETPGFAGIANARLWRRQREAQEKGQGNTTFRDVFTPTRPKKAFSEFSGRREMIGMIVEAVEEERAHVVICGENGLGKTSLANVVGGFAKSSGYLVVRVSGAADLTFPRLIRIIFEELDSQVSDTPSGRVLKDQLGVKHLVDLIADADEIGMMNDILGKDTLDVTTVNRALEKLDGNQALVIIDDYDRIEDRGLKTKIAQVMKALSDQGGWLCFVVMGRGENPSDLLKDDLESISNAVGISLDPMSADEVFDLVQTSANRIGIHMSDDVIHAVIRLSQGVPHVAQWLSFLAVRRANRRKAGAVKMEDLALTVSEAVAKIEPSLRVVYNKLLASEAGLDQEDLLYLAVRVPCMVNGLFSAKDMAEHSENILDRALSVAEVEMLLEPLCGDNEMAVLRKVQAPDGMYYRFTNPTMRSVIMLKKVVRLPFLSGSGSKGGAAALLPGPDMT